MSPQGFDASREALTAAGWLTEVLRQEIARLPRTSQLGAAQVRQPQPHTVIVELPTGATIRLDISVDQGETT